MRVIIAGGREIEDYELLLTAIKKSKFKIKEVVSGTAKGVDTLGERYAEEKGIPVKRFPAEWNNLELPGAEIRTKLNKWTGKEDKYVFNAGFIRNGQMADYADACIVVPGEGSGSRDMAKKAKEKGLKVYVHEPPKETTNDEDTTAYEYTF